MKLKSKIGGKVPDWFEAKIFKPFIKFTPNFYNLYSISSAFECFEDAGWTPGTEEEKN